VQEFISEDDLTTFDGWLKYQNVDPETTKPDDLETWRGMYEEGRKLTLDMPKVGLMKIQRVPGEHLYAVAVREGSDLWLTMWVRHSWKGEFFAVLARQDRQWDAHASYHRDGNLHIKNDDGKCMSRKCQPLTGVFRGTQPLVTFAGYGPKSVGAICDPGAFTAVVELTPGILGPRDGQITVDLVEPNCVPAASPWTKIVERRVFHDTFPEVMITVESFI
jgi:hypothetical protein